VFSLLPPDNATGNFTKIVQRVAVRIEVPTNVAEQEVLRPHVGRGQRRHEEDRRGDGCGHGDSERAVDAAPLRDGT